MYDLERDWEALELMRSLGALRCVKIIFQESKTGTP